MWAENIVHIHNCCGFLGNNPDVFCNTPEEVSSLHTSGLYWALLPLCCFSPHWKYFSSFFTNTFTAIMCCPIRSKAKRPKRGSPPWLILLPPPEHLTSANLGSGETGEMRGCFKLRGFCVNQDLTVDPWWVYRQEVSYSWCKTGKAWADLTRMRAGWGGTRPAATFFPFSSRLQLCGIESENDLKAERDGWNIIQTFTFSIVFVLTWKYSMLVDLHSGSHTISETPPSLTEPRTECVGNVFVQDRFKSSPYIQVINEAFNRY